MEDARNEKLQAYFTALAPNYAHLTSNITKRFIADLLSSVPLGINSYSTIHDNGSGPATAAEAAVEWCKARAIAPAKITITDVNSAMIEAAKKNPILAALKVEAEVMDSQHLRYPENAFQFVFCNFSIFTFPEPLRALLHIHRTLKANGITVITCWKHFGVAEVISQAQKIIKGAGAGGEMTQPWPEFQEEGYLAKLLDAAGFESGKIKTLEKRLVISEEQDLQGLIEFASGDFTADARVGWSEEDINRWPAAVKEVIADMKRKDGGVVMEAWIVLGRKWNEMYG